MVTLFYQEATFVKCQPSSWLVCISSTVHYSQRQPDEATHGSLRLKWHGQVFTCPCHRLLTASCIGLSVAI